MFKGLRKMVGLLSLEERLQEYLALEEQEAIEKSNRDQLALSYAEHTRTLNLCKGETDEFVVNKIQDKYDTFFAEYKKELVKAKGSYDKLKNKREKLLKNEELSKAVKLHKAHEKFDNGEISLEIYDKIIKAVTKNKVKYADMIIFNNESKFLILQRAKDDNNGGKWVIPGGHVDPGETFDEAAQRELLEESGIKVTKCEKVGEFINKDIHIEYHETRVEDENEAVITLDNKETHDYKWIYISELKDYEMVFDMKENLEKIYKPWKKDVVKLTKAFLSGQIVSKEILEKTISLVIEKAKYSPQVQSKMEKVMGEFKDGTLKHGSTGKTVTDRKMAIAIALSESGVSKSEDEDEEVEKAVETEIAHFAQADGSIKEVLIEKARSGKYANTPQNRKLNRVGQTYGSAKKEEPTKGKGTNKEHNFSTNKEAFQEQVTRARKVLDGDGDEKSKEKAKEFLTAAKEHNKTFSEKKPQDLGESAKEASGSALETASKEAKDSETRTAAHTEIARRDKEEKPQEEEKKEADDTSKEVYTLSEARRLSKLGKTDPEGASKEAQEYADLYSEEAKDPEAQRFGKPVKDIKDEYDRVISNIKSGVFPPDPQEDYDYTIKKKLFTKEIDQLEEEDVNALVRVAKVNGIADKTSLFHYMTGYFGDETKAKKFVSEHNPFK